MKKKSTRLLIKPMRSFQQLGLSTLVIRNFSFHFVVRLTTLFSRLCDLFAVRHQQELYIYVPSKAIFSLRIHSEIYLPSLKTERFLLDAYPCIHSEMYSPTLKKDMDLPTAYPPIRVSTQKHTSYTNNTNYIYEINATS